MKHIAEIEGLTREVVALGVKWARLQGLLDLHPHTHGGVRCQDGAWLPDCPMCEVYSAALEALKGKE